jgi:hypothetical protein
MQQLPGCEEADDFDIRTADISWWLWRRTSNVHR